MPTNLWAVAPTAQGPTAQAIARATAAPPHTGDSSSISAGITSTDSLRSLDAGSGQGDSCHRGGAAARPGSRTTLRRSGKHPSGSQGEGSGGTTCDHRRATVDDAAGAPARTASNMDASLTVPTATSVRAIPVKLLWDNRIVINNHLARARGGKVSFTHLIGYALVKALKTMPEMNNGFDVIDGKPTLIEPAHINLGLAIDLPKPDGSRQLLVPSVKAAETMDFAGFWTAYEDLVRKARGNKLEVSDFQGTTFTLTNPGGIGTNHSVPRLMKGQGCIIGVGSMEYPRSSRARRRRRWPATPSARS